MSIINLKEIKQGYYWETYTIPWNSQSGVWVLSLESIKEEGNSLKVGGSNISIKIKPASLKIDIIEPSLDEYTSKDIIEIKVNLRYPDNKIVENATVTLDVLNEKITLNEQDNGSYFHTLDIKDETFGRYIIKFSASDQFGNNVSAIKIIQINRNTNSEKDSNFPFVFLLGVISCIIIVVFLVLYISKRLNFLRSQDIHFENEELEKLQKEAARKYYIDGSISRATYDMLRKEHEERIAELKIGKEKFNFSLKKERKDE